MTSVDRNHNTLAVSSFPIADICFLSFYLELLASDVHIFCWKKKMFRLKILIHYKDRFLMFIQTAPVLSNKDPLCMFSTKSVIVPHIDKFQNCCWYNKSSFFWLCFMIMNSASGILVSVVIQLVMLIILLM